MTVAVLPDTRFARERHDEQGDSSARRVDEDRALFARYLDPDDPLDRDIVVERFLPLARKLARRYHRGDEPFEDLFQVACIGLLNAVDRFDPDRGLAFTSYAVPTIVGEIKRYFRDKTWAIRVPRDLQELSLRIERLASQLEADLQRPPTVKELAAAADATDEDVLEALQAAGVRRTASLDAPRAVDDADDTVADTVGTHDEGFALAEDRAVLDRLTRRLSAREREVLRLRFEEDMTQSEIGAVIGVSQMQVSRIIRAAIGKLRDD